MDNHFLEVCREQARERGILEPDIDEWLGRARPLLVLHRGQDDPTAANAPVAGYFGGDPSLPADVEWSGTPDFIAAVDCAALPPDLPGFPLPKDGHLLFFHCTDYVGPECVDPDHDGRVLYIPAGTATAERITTTDRHPELKPEQFALQCSPSWDPPHGCCGSVPDHFHQALAVLEDPRPTYARDVEQLMLGGYCVTWTSDPCDIAEYSDPEHKTWQRLASIQRDLLMDDMDDPVQPFFVHWMIREDDLVEQRFDRVRTYTEDLFAYK